VRTPDTSQAAARSVDAESIAKIEEKIRRILKAKGCIKTRDLKRALHVNQTGIWAFQAATNNLISRKEIEVDKNGTYLSRQEDER
jgi:hypothetical protein